MLGSNFIAWGSSHLVLGIVGPAVARAFQLGESDWRDYVKVAVEVLQDIPDTHAGVAQAQASNLGALAAGGVV